MGSGYTWIEGGSYYQGLIPGPLGPPADIGAVTDIISSASTNATVADAPNAPQITPPSGNYEQPGTDAPSLSAEVAESSAISAPGPNVLTPGVAFQQPDSGNPPDNPAIDASTAAAGAAGKNPMGLGGTWSGNYQQPM